MNQLQVVPKSQIVHDAQFEKQVISAVNDAYHAVDSATQKCLIAGQLLNEMKEHLGHEKFMPWVEKTFPEVTHNCCNRWMRGMSNVLKALPAPPIDIEVSVVLTTPKEQLAPAQQKYKQAFLNLTDGRTLKECTSGVFVEGDEPHRIDRAINGKTKGGAGGDRKDFPRFVARHLGAITSMLVVKKKGAAPKARQLAADQRANIGGSFAAALKQWPRPILEVIKEAAAQELKLSDEQRAARE